jgi:hypothetical protein
MPAVHDFDRLGGLYWTAFSTAVVDDVDEANRHRPERARLRVSWGLLQPEVTVHDLQGRGVQCYMSRLPPNPYIHGRYAPVSIHTVFSCRGRSVGHLSQEGASATRGRGGASDRDTGGRGARRAPAVG